MKYMKNNIKLVALDMDGTLFNEQSQVSAADQEAIREISAKGVTVVISTGRPYVGLPVDVLTDIGIRYAITTNGASIYRLCDMECIYSNCMEPEFVCPIIRELQKKDIHMDAFIEGKCYSQRSCEPQIDRLDMPEPMRNYIKSTRFFPDDLAAYIIEHRLPVQKMTLNFYLLPDGTFQHRDDTLNILASHPEITYLSGGYHNLEFTRRGTTKGTGLRMLCDYLGIDIASTMACGDTQNDMDIIKTAAIGVAMGNAIDEVKAAADYITLSNEESGVAHAIRHYILN